MAGGVGAGQATVEVEVRGGCKTRRAAQRTSHALKLAKGSDAHAFDWCVHGDILGVVLY
jgi:molybdopterin-binding protein